MLANFLSNAFSPRVDQSGKKSFKDWAPVTTRRDLHECCRQLAISPPNSQGLERPDCYQAAVFANYSTLTVFSNCERNPLQEFLVPNNYHPLMKYHLSRIGNKSPFTGGVSKPFVKDYQADMKQWYYKMPEQCTTGKANIFIILKTITPEMGGITSLFFNNLILETLLHTKYPCISRN